MPVVNDSVIALDVGNARVGVALANLVSKIAQPYTTLERSDNIFEELKSLIDKENVSQVVVGLPRGLDGQNTAQTEAAKQFAEELIRNVRLPIIFQDEALTSVKAKEELEQRGKDYKKSDIDALAATYILEDWLADNKEDYEV